LALSLFVSTQERLQAVVVGKQLPLATHAPPEHAWVAVQTLPQRPQLFGSLTTGMHAPLQRYW
jgi:hypothetical protein